MEEASMENSSDKSALPISPIEFSNPLKALSSKENAFSNASLSTVNNDRISNPFSLSTSPNTSLVKTFTDGFASCCFTISLFADSSATCFVRDFGYAIPAFKDAALLPSAGCTTPTIVSSSPSATSCFIKSSLSDLSFQT